MLHLNNRQRFIELRLCILNMRQCHFNIDCTVCCTTMSTFVWLKYDLGKFVLGCLSRRLK